MRHFFTLALAIAPLTLSMTMASATTVLVTLTGLAYRHGACRWRATPGAIALAAIAVRTDHHLAVATGTVVESGSRFHR